MEWRGIWNYVGNLIPGRSQEKVDEEDIFEDVFEEGKREREEEDEEGRQEGMEKRPLLQGEKGKEDRGGKIGTKINVKSDHKNMIPEHKGNIQSKEAMEEREKSAFEDEEVVVGGGEVEADEADGGEKGKEEDEEDEEEEEGEEEKGDLDGDVLSSSSGSSDYVDSEDVDTEIENNNVIESTDDTTNSNVSETTEDMSGDKKTGDKTSEWENPKDFVQRTANADGKKDDNVGDKNNEVSTLKGKEKKGMREDDDGSTTYGGEREMTKEVGKTIDKVEECHEKDSEELEKSLRKMLQKENSKVKDEVKIGNKEIVEESNVNKESNVKKVEESNVTEQKREESNVKKVEESNVTEQKGEESNVKKVEESSVTEQKGEESDMNEIFVNKSNIETEIDENHIGRNSNTSLVMEESNKKEVSKVGTEGEEELEEKGDELNETIKASEEEIEELIVTDKGDKVGICFQNENIANEDANIHGDKETGEVTDGSKDQETDNDDKEKGIGEKANGIMENKKINCSVKETEVNVVHDKLENGEKTKNEANIGKDKNKTPIIDLQGKVSDEGKSSKETKKKGESDREDRGKDGKENQNKEKKNSKKKSYFEGEEFERKSAMATMMNKGILEMEILTHPTSSLQFSDIAKKIMKEVQESRSSPKTKSKSFPHTKKTKELEMTVEKMKSYQDDAERNGTEEDFSKGSLYSEPKFKEEKDVDSLNSLSSAKKESDAKKSSEEEVYDTLPISKLIGTSSRLSDEDTHRFSSLKTSDTQDESYKSLERTPDVLHSCIKVFNPLKSSVSMTRGNNGTSDTLKKSGSKKLSVTFKTEDESINESSKESSTNSQEDSQTPDILPLTPSPSLSECSFPSISPTDNSQASISLMEITASLPSPSGISSSHSVSTHRTPPLKPIDNSLSSSSLLAISSSSCSISNLSLAPPTPPYTSPPHPTPPEIFLPHPSPPETSPLRLSPPETFLLLPSSPETCSSLPTPPVNPLPLSSPHQTSLSLYTSPETSPLLSSPSETCPPLLTPPENSSMPEHFPSPPENFPSLQEKYPLKIPSHPISSLKTISSPPTSHLKTSPPLSSPVKKSPPGPSSPERSTSFSSSPSEKFPPPVTPEQKPFPSSPSSPSSFPPVVTEGQDSGSIKPSTAVAGERLQPDTSDPKRLEAEGKRLHQYSTDTGRVRVLDERSVDPSAFTGGGKQPFCWELLSAENKSGNIIFISDSEDRNTDDNDVKVTDDGCDININNTNKCVNENVKEEFSDSKNLPIASVALSCSTSNQICVIETSNDVIAGDDVTRDIIGGSYLPSETIKTLQNTAVSSSLEVLENVANESKEIGNHGYKKKEKGNIEKNNVLDKLQETTGNKRGKKGSFDDDDDNDDDDDDDDNDPDNLEGPWSSPQLAKVVQELVVCKKFKMTTAQAKKRQHNISRLDIPTKDRTVIFDSTKLSSKGKSEKNYNLPQIELSQDKKTNGSQEDILKGVTRKWKTATSHNGKSASSDKDKNVEADNNISETSISSRLQEENRNSPSPTAEGQRLFTKNTKSGNKKIPTPRGKLFGRVNSDSSKTETSKGKGKVKEDSKMLPSPKIERLCHSPQFRKGKTFTGSKKDTTSQRSPRQSPVRFKRQSSPKYSPQSESPKSGSRRGSCSSSNPSPRLNSSRKTSPKLGSNVSSKSGSPKSSPRLSGSPRLLKNLGSPKSSKKFGSPKIASAKIIKPVVTQVKSQGQRSPKSSPVLIRKRIEYLNKQRIGKQDGRKSKANDWSSRRSSTSSTKGGEDVKSKDSEIQKDETINENMIKSVIYDNSGNVKVKKEIMLEEDDNQDINVESSNNEIKENFDECERKEIVENGDKEIPDVNEKDSENTIGDAGKVNGNDNETVDVVKNGNRNDSETVDEIKNENTNNSQNKMNDDQLLQKMEITSEPSTPTKPFKGIHREISDCKQRLESFMKNKSMQDQHQQRFVYIASKMSGKLDAEIIQFFENQQQNPREILRNEKLIQEHFKGNPKTEKRSSKFLTAAVSVANNRITTEDKDENKLNTSVHIQRNLSFSKDISTKVYPLATKTKEKTIQEESGKRSIQGKEELEEIESKHGENLTPEYKTQVQEIEERVDNDDNKENMKENEDKNILSCDEDRSNQEQTEDPDENRNLIPEECNLRKEVDSDITNYGNMEIHEEATCDARVKIKEEESKENLNKEENKEKIINGQDAGNEENMEKLKDSSKTVHDKDVKITSDIHLEQYAAKGSTRRRDEMIARFKQDDGIMIEKIRSIKGIGNEKPLEIKYDNYAVNETYARLEQAAIVDITDEEKLAASPKDLEDEDKSLDDLEKISLIDDLLDDALIEEDLRGTDTDAEETSDKIELVEINVHNSISKTDGKEKEKSEVIITSKDIVSNTEGLVDIKDSFMADMNKGNYENYSVIPTAININSYEADVILSPLNELSISDKVNQKTSELHENIKYDEDFDDNDIETSTRSGISEKGICRVISSTQVGLSKLEESEQDADNRNMKIKSGAEECILMVEQDENNKINSEDMQEEVHEIEISFTEGTLLENHEEQCKQSSSSNTKQEPEVTYANILPKVSRLASSDSEILQSHKEQFNHNLADTTTQKPEVTYANILPKASRLASSNEERLVNHEEQSSQYPSGNIKQEPEVTYANILPKANRLVSSGSEIKIENIRLGGELDRKKSPVEKENRVTRRLMPSHRRLTKTISEGNFKLVGEPTTDADDGTSSKSAHLTSFIRSQIESEFHKDKLEAAVSDMSKTSTVSEIFARGVSGKIRAKSRSVENIRLSSLSCVEITNSVDIPPLTKSNSACRIVGVLKKKDSRENVLELMSSSHGEDQDSDSDHKSPTNKDPKKSDVAFLQTDKCSNLDNQKSHRHLSKQKPLVKIATEQIESTLMEQAQPLESLIKESIKSVEVMQGKLSVAGSSTTERHIYENIPEVFLGKTGVLEVSSQFNNIRQGQINTLDEKPKNLVAKVVHIYENLPAPGQLMDPPPGKLKGISSAKPTETEMAGSISTGRILKAHHIQDQNILKKEQLHTENVPDTERTETKEPFISPVVTVKPPRSSSEPASPKQSTLEKTSLRRRQQPESESRIEKQKSNYMKQRSVRVGILKKQKSDITGVRLQKLHYFDSELPGERRRSYSIGADSRKGSKSAKQEGIDEQVSDNLECPQRPETSKLELSELEKRCHSSVSTSSNSSRSSTIDKILQSCAPCISSNTGSTLDLTVKSAVHPLGGGSDTDSFNKCHLADDSVFNETESSKNQSVVSHLTISKSAFRTSSSSSDVGTSLSSETNSEMPSGAQLSQNGEDLTVKSGHTNVSSTSEESKSSAKDPALIPSQVTNETAAIISSETCYVANDDTSSDNEEKASLYVSFERDGSTPTLQQVDTGDTDFYSELLDTILSVVDAQDPACSGDSVNLCSKSYAARKLNASPSSSKNVNSSKASQNSLKSKVPSEAVSMEPKQGDIKNKQEPISPKKEEPERRAGTSDSDSTASVDSELAEVRRRITERFPPAPREESQASQESVMASPSAVCPMPNCAACRCKSINSSQPLVFNFDKPVSPTCCEPARAASLSYVDQACEGTIHEVFVRSTSLPHDPEVYHSTQLVCRNDHDDDEYWSATSEDTGRHTPQRLSLPLNDCTPLEDVKVETSPSQISYEQSSLENKSQQNSSESQQNSSDTPVPDYASSQDDDDPTDINDEEFKDHSESSSNQLAEEMSQLRLENEKLSARNRSLQREVEELRRVKESMVEEDLQLKPQINQMTMELTHAKEALSALKADRKRLKAEKFDLLNQMKQLYATLEDKEKELRDFIRNYEQRMKESDESLRHLAAERDETEREKWNILKHARDESEKVVKLSAQLGLKESTLRKLQDELEMVRKQLASVGYYSDAESVRTNGLPTPTASTPTCSPQPISTPTPTPNGRGSSADSGVRLSSDRDSTASHDGGVGTPKESPSLSPLYATPSSMRGEDRTGDNTPTCGGPTPPGTSLNSSAMSGLASSTGGLSRSAEQLCERLAEGGDTSKVRGSTTLTRKSNKSGGTWGSISRVFARQKKRAALDASLYDGNGSDKRASWSPSSSLCVSPLTEESYSEKLRLLEEAQHIPLERWKAPTVLAWLEVTLGMPQYGAMCAENVRSGKVLLELSDSELEAGLGISHPMHRKKLRLAIEELREPRLTRFPRISILGHTWVSSEWLPDLGLPQYCDAFANNLVDGRLLEALTKKELEKHLGVHRKFHQASIIHGVHLLRIVRFDRQTLAERRRQSEHVDCDPIVWTNIRWVRWARSIDLAEYADNLKDSGVHGALVVLESSFTSDTMATALGIPQSKNIIRRHLATELESLVNPARQQLDEQARYAKLERRRQEKLAAGGSLGRSFSRSYGTGLEKAEKDKRRASLRGSLSRALGLRVREEINAVGNNGGESSSSGGQSPAVSSRTHPHHHPPQTRPRSSVMPAGVYVHHETHRRVKSIGDIETITVTPV